MFQHGGWEDKTTYNLQTIKDDLCFFTPEILDEINQLVVKAGHKLVKKNVPKDGPSELQTKKTEPRGSAKSLRARCDSFVVETNVHHPTDINLLLDAIRKTIEECARLSRSYQLMGWRQYSFNIRQFKKQYHIVRNLTHSTSKDKQKRGAREEVRRKEYLKYVIMAETYHMRAVSSLELLGKRVRSPNELLLLREYMGYAKKLMGQIIRRVLFNEIISHQEKTSPSSSPTTSGSARARRECR